MFNTWQSNDPKHSRIIEAYNNGMFRDFFNQASSNPGQSCSNCGGSGWVIITDPNGGTTGGTCMACSGSGQSSL